MSARMTMLTVAGFAAASVMTVSLVAQSQTTKPMNHGMKADTSKSVMTKAQKIQNAQSAAPAAIAAKATILDWPSKEGAQPEVLQAGSNGWSCLPDMPESDGDDPMCIDDPWMKWVDGLLNKKAPAITRVGIGYMIAPGGAWASNNDPYSMTKTATNQWSFHPAHLMIVVPNVKDLAGLSTDPNNGGPYVMFAGTPYAHIMAPTAVTPAASKTNR
jgi:hypothetical protein